MSSTRAHFLLEVILETTLRPLDRRPKAVQITIKRVDHEGSATELEWVIVLRHADSHRKAS
jgi:hypothetical protein